MKASEVLHRAKEKIERDGWHQGSLRGDDDSVCLVGACLSSGMSYMGDILGVEKSLNRAIGFIQTDPDDPLHPFAQWNDAPERTKAEVLDALTWAAKYAEEDEALGVAE